MWKVNRLNSIHLCIVGAIAAFRMWNVFVQETMWHSSPTGVNNHSLVHREVADDRATVCHLVGKWVCILHCPMMDDSCWRLFVNAWHTGMGGWGVTLVMSHKLSQHVQGTDKWVEIWLSSLGNKLLWQCHLVSGTGTTSHLYYRSRAKWWEISWQPCCVIRMRYLLAAGFEAIWDRSIKNEVPHHVLVGWGGMGS